jgi:cell wall-associated NlpC family hydrolase
LSKKNKSYVCEGAKLRCRFGDQESTLKVPMRFAQIEGKGQAVLSDSVANKNIFPFGRCKPRKCPCTPAPDPQGWRLYEESVLINVGFGYKDALLESSILICKKGGAISIVDSGCTDHTTGAKGILSNLKNEEKDKKKTGVAIKKADKNRDKNKANDKKIDKAKSAAGKKEDESKKEKPNTSIIVSTARSYKNLPYGHSPRELNKADINNKDTIVDCSELTYRSYLADSITIPQNADAQYKYFKSQSKLITEPDGGKPGDIVFFTEPAAGRITHVAIVSEVNERCEIRYVHAPRPGRTVEETKFVSMKGPYYSSHFVAYGRY